MAALASIDDYAAFTGGFPADPARVSRLLEAASDAVLFGAHGQNITEATYTVAVVPYEGVAYLPQRPVSDVAAVTVAGQSLPASSWRWSPGGNRRPAVLERVDGTDVVPWTDGPLAVTFTAGWDPVPGPVVAAVVAIVKGLIDSAGAAPMTQESAGPFRVSFASAHIQGPDMSLTLSTRRMLDRLCGVDGPGSPRVMRDHP